MADFLQLYPWHIAYTCNVSMAHCWQLQRIHGTLLTIATYPWHIADNCNVSMAHCWQLQRIHGTLLTIATYPWHIAYTQPPNYSNFTRYPQFMFPVKCTLQRSYCNKRLRISCGRCSGCKVSGTVQYCRCLKVSGTVQYCRSLPTFRAVLPRSPSFVGTHQLTLWETRNASNRSAER